MVNENLVDIINGMLIEAARIRKYDLSTEVTPDLLDLKKKSLQRMAEELHQKYNPLLKDTPEAEYLSLLVKFYDGNQRPMSSHDHIYKRIDELELPTRIANCLNSYKFYDPEQRDLDYIGELVQKTKNELLRIKGFGFKSLNQLNGILEPLGLRLGMEIDFVRPPK